jgi:predicted nucleic acid-binding protein
MGMRVIQISNQNIYLDANIFIYLLEGYEEYSPIIKKIFDKIDNGISYGITSELTLAEVLVKPILDDNVKLQKIYEQTLQASSLLNVVSISRDILLKAAQLRKNPIKLPDAIHLATAFLNNCEIFLTNDKRLKQFTTLEVVLLSEIKDSTII